MKKHGIAPARFRVETLAGFALRWSASYPRISGVTDFQPEGSSWANVYLAFLEILKSERIRDLIAMSYSGVFVDEYQDCTLIQHEIVCALGDVLPVRIVGDDLQGIFDFAEPTVDFDADLASFDKLGELDVPHRWMEANPELGDWLLSIRESIRAGNRPNFEEGPVTRFGLNEMVRACFHVAGKQGSIAVVRKWARDAHGLAMRLNGALTSMEEVECKDLLEAARRIETAEGYTRSIEVIDFAASCMTQVSSRLRGVRRGLEAERIVRPRVADLEPVIGALSLVGVSVGLAPVEAALREIAHLDPASVLYRRELFSEMINALRLKQADPSLSLRDAAWQVRDRARQHGREVEHRTVSRTLLIKGLEFDHAVVLDIVGPARQRLTTKELYVALTRGRSSLAVVC
jgi:DNA helicase-2/ATP-dependent DNA helicase PcrA